MLAHLKTTLYVLKIRLTNKCCHLRLAKKSLVSDGRSLDFCLLWRSPLWRNVRFQQLALFKPLIDFVLVILTLILFGIRRGEGLLSWWRYLCWYWVLMIMIHWCIWLKIRCWSLNGDELSNLEVWIVVMYQIMKSEWW